MFVCVYVAYLASWNARSGGVANDTTRRLLTLIHKPKVIDTVRTICFEGTPKELTPR